MARELLFVARIDTAADGFLRSDSLGKLLGVGAALMGVKDITDTLALARYYRDTIFAAMNELRIIVDEMETHCAAKYWPYPSYGDILFSVK